jgi:2-aminoethylphosphonate-pyruvate transaminase
MNIKRQILLNPGPATTSDSVKLAQVVPDICPREKEFGALMARIGQQLVCVVHGGDEYVAVMFGGSGTAAVEACISSVVAHDKKILIVDNGAYGRRMIEIAQTYQIEVVPYAIEWGDYPDLEVIESLLRQHQGQIEHLAIVHHETTTGMLNPVEACADLAHQYGVQIIVDAMSSFAGLPINIKQSQLDYLISSSNKCIQAMAGVSFVICKRTSLEQSAHIRPRSYYLNLLAQHQYFEKSQQFRFTPPVQVLYALEQALVEYFQETGEGRHRRYSESYDELIVGLARLGFQLLLPAEQRSKLLTAVIEPTHPNYSYDAMHDYLIERGFTIYPGKGASEATFRLANIGKIDKQDISAFIEALSQYLVDAGLMGQL